MGADDTRHDDLRRVRSTRKRGNTRGGGEPRQTFNWNSQGGLLAVSSTAKYVTYVMDAEGRRVGRKSGATQAMAALDREWMYDGQLRIVAEVIGARLYDADLSVSQFSLASVSTTRVLGIGYDKDGLVSSLGGLAPTGLTIVRSPTAGLLLSMTCGSPAVAEAMSYDGFGAPEC